jgi:hypothetical protein
MQTALAVLAVLIVLSQTHAEYRTGLVRAAPERDPEEVLASKGEGVKPEPPAQAHKASDVVLIANWLCGHDPVKAFPKPFGDSKCVTDGKDPLLYTDIPGVKAPAGMKAVTYEFAQARMRRIKSGHQVAPAVLIVCSSWDEPAEGEPRRATRESGGRVYYVEVAIGNLAWHWLKVVVRDEGDKANARVVWHKVS